MAGAARLGRRRAGGPAAGPGRPTDRGVAAPERGAAAAARRAAPADAGDPGPAHRTSAAGGFRRLTVPPRDGRPLPAPVELPAPVLVDGKPVVTSGNERVTIAISGQVNRAINVANDGSSTKAYFVDNDASNSRIRFVGTGQVTDDFDARLEDRGGDRAQRVVAGQPDQRGQRRLLRRALRRGLGRERALRQALARQGHRPHRTTPPRSTSRAPMSSCMRASPTRWVACGSAPRTAI